MPISIRMFAVAGMLVAYSCAQSLAGQADFDPDGSATWAAGPRGPWININPDGSWRLRSKFSTPVEFADRRGIAKAQIIAEEKAKAALVRFMKQDVASARVVTEIQNDLNKATQERATESKATITKTDTRTVIENLTEITSSIAAATLRGVVILEEGYDDNTKEAWVVVGISNKTVDAARATQRMIDSPAPGNRSNSDNSSLGMQPSEVRRFPQKDW